ncbi:unnamed protein product [Caenorhabditis brenneri]
MEKLSNHLEKIAWSFRRLMRIPQKTVAPVLWRPSTISSSHEPSDKYLSKLTEEQKEKVERIKEELRLFSMLSLRFPTKLRDSDWNVLLEVKTRKNRLDQMLFLYRKEQLELNDEKKKKLIKEERKSQSPRSKNPSYILSIQNSMSNDWVKLRNVVEAYRLENRPILAVDCQFLSRLSPRGRGLTALQLQYLITENRNQTDPFRLYFVNYDRTDQKVRELEKEKLLSLQSKEVFCPIVTEKGLDAAFIGPKPPKEIIYLSPDAEQELESVDDDSVYVIGGIVDRVVEHGIPKHASLEAAQSAKVTARKLPIDKFIDFKSGSKFLTLLAVSEILRQVNLHGDWEKALAKAIPVRNTRGSDEKNPKAQAAQARIHNFNQEILRRVDRILGEDKSR